MNNEKLLHYIDIITSDLQGRYEVSEEKAVEATYRAFANVWDKDYAPEAFFSYFRTAAKNELVHMFRYEKKYPFDSEIDLSQELFYEQEYEGDTGELDRIADRLPKVYVKLFELLREGIDHREIARRLNKSHGAVRTMKTRMIQYCQAVLVALMMFVLLPTLAFGQVEIIATDGNPYQVWVGDSLTTERTFDDLHKAIQYSVRLGEQFPDSMLYVRRKEEYRITGFPNPAMVGQLIRSAFNTSDSAFSHIKFEGTEIDSILIINN